MSFIPTQLIPYRKLLLAALVVMVVTAWFSVGYYHPDEHYQLFEFYNFRHGYSPLSDLPWEYAVRCRAALQPFIVYCCSVAFESVGIYNPFLVAGTLRVLMALLMWYTTVRITAVLLPDFATERGRKFFVTCSFLLWFIPYLGVRFSAENIAAIFFFQAVSIILAARQRNNVGGIGSIIMVGLLLGFTVFLRLQMGFAIAGLGLWLLFMGRWPLRFWLAMVTAALVAMGLSVLVDHWFYGEWVFTPYNYFDINIIKNVAAKFGVDPWYHYFILFAKLAIMPLSLCLLPLFIAGVARRKTHLYAFVTLCFVIGHMAIGHKEMRFLFPMVLPLVYFASVGIEPLLTAHGHKKWWSISYRVLVVFNCAILAFRMFAPSTELVRYYSFLFHYTQAHPTTIVYFDQSPYKLDVIESNYYKPRVLDIQKMQSAASLDSLLHHTGKDVIYLSRTLQPGPELQGFKTERIYCLYPSWLLKYNINHWQDRSYIWAVFRIRL